MCWIYSNLNYQFDKQNVAESTKTQLILIEIVRLQ